jgi:abelson tyrosine-protein kinase 1
MTPEPIISEEPALTHSSLPHPSSTEHMSSAAESALIDRSKLMMRSSSSHGGFSARKLQQHELRALASSPLSEKSAAVHRGAVVAAHDLEFPPPPTGAMTQSTYSPRAARRGQFADGVLPDRLGRGALASPRARHRDASSDSCADEADSAAPQHRGYFNVDSSSTPKSPVSPTSEGRSLESPAVGSLSSPGSVALEDAMMAMTMHAKTASMDRQSFAPARNSEAEAKADMESRLLNELKDKRFSTSEQHLPQQQQTPAAQLVTELFESLRTKSLTKKPPPPLEDKPTVTAEVVDFKANLRKVSTKKDEEKPSESTNSHEVDFKSSLRKREDSAEVAPTQEDDDEQCAIVDFKSKLRKSKAATPSTEEPVPEKSAVDANVDFKARLRKVSGNKPVVTLLGKNGEEAKSNGNGVVQVANEADEDKRKSTGSISSLRKMWESGEPSPALGGRKASLKVTSPSCESVTSPTDDKPGTTVKFEKRVWPPVPSTETEGKPMVPVKPTVKPPPPTTKPPPPKESPFGGLKSTAASKPPPTTQ